MSHPAAHINLAGFGSSFQFCAFEEAHRPVRKGPSKYAFDRDLTYL